LPRRDKILGLIGLTAIVVEVWVLIGWRLGLACALAVLSGALLAKYQNKGDKHG